MALLALMVAGAVSDLAAQRTFHVDPARGKAGAPGSLSQPWGSLADAMAGPHWKDVAGGDRIVLGDGAHGVLAVSGTFDPPLVVEGPERGAARLDGLDVEDAAGWTFRGLVIGPAAGASTDRRSLVVVGDRRPTRGIVVEGCHVRAATDHEGWTSEPWLALPNGMLAGRVSEGIVFCDNFVEHVRHGITLTGPDGVAEGNVVTDLSADGIRITRPGCRVRFNIVKNGFCGSDHGDGNHDDGIQCFVYPKPPPERPADRPAEPDGGGRTTAEPAARDTSTLRDVVVTHNLIINWEDDDQPLQATMQGIGFFDGPMYDFVVEDNVVCVSHWHGISLYDAVGCRIARNTVYTRWTDSKLRPWVMLGQKHGLARGNVVEGNRAHSVKLGADAEVEARDNGLVRDGDFRTALRRLQKTIEDRYGARHDLADRPRLELRWKP